MKRKIRTADERGNSMKERPILFSGPMVRALLEGRKTQTWRVVKPQPKNMVIRAVQEAPGERCKWYDADCIYPGVEMICPYGQPGDRLWVKETHWLFGRWHKNGMSETGRQKWKFHADRACGVMFAPTAFFPSREQNGWHKRPSIFMPHWASRITLEITKTPVERLRDISPNDCRAEGMPKDNNDIGVRYGYGQLWNQINGKGSWDANPWVWVITFRKL
jgi:hypothetical protein